MQFKRIEDKALHRIMVENSARLYGFRLTSSHSSRGRRRVGPSKFFIYRDRQATSSRLPDRAGLQRLGDRRRRSDRSRACSGLLSRMSPYGWRRYGSNIHLKQPLTIALGYASSL